MNLHKNLYTNVESSIIHNSSKVETTPNVYQWIDEVWRIRSMEYYSARERDEILTPAWHPQGWAWRASRHGSEASHKRPHRLLFHVCEMSKIGKTTETESPLSISWGPWGCRRWGGGVTAKSFFSGWWTIWVNIEPLNQTLLKGELQDTWNLPRKELLFKKERVDGSILDSALLNID